MALLKCPECGEMISEFAPFCIHCGCPMEKIRELLSDSEKSIVIDMAQTINDKGIEKTSDNSNMCFDAPNYIIQFIDDVAKMLNDNNINFVKSSTSDLVGFRPTAKDRLLIYVLKKNNGKYEFRYLEKGMNTTTPVSFDEKNIPQYFEKIRSTFHINDRENQKDKLPETNFHESAVHIVKEPIYDWDYAINDVISFMTSKGFTSDKQNGKVLFYKNDDLKNDVTFPWFSIEIFLYSNETSFRKMLKLNYCLDPKNNKKQLIYLGFNLSDAALCIKKQIDKVVYHRELLSRLLGYSVYGNIIRWSNNYSDDFPEDFTDIKNKIDNHRYYANGIYKYKDAIDFYNNYKYEIVRSVLSEKMSEKGTTSLILDFNKYEYSLKECVAKNDYDLGHIKGVTTAFASLLDDDYYKRTYAKFLKYDSELINDKLLNL